MTVTVIIVTHDNDRVIHKAMEHLSKQSRPADEIIIVDSGSKEMSYLDQYKNRAKIIKGGEEIGFCRANNIGMDHISPTSKYIFFLNPDAFPFRDFIKNALTFMEKPSNQYVGAITGITYGYSIEKDEPSGKYDTTGIFQKWYGKWEDRAQGQIIDPNLFQQFEPIPAICGAVFFARKDALESIKLPNNDFFCSSFFMYKEDIDLSLRLRKKDWKLYFVPQLECYHCRGWNPNRRQMSRFIRSISAKNELFIHLRERHLCGIIYSSLKLFTVKVFNR